MITSRDGHTAILLPDGTVMIPGGIVLQDRRTLILSSPNAELYDPASGTFNHTGDYADWSPSWETATLLSDGRVLLTGCAGQCSDDGGQATEVFDPQTGTFSLTSPMTTYCSAGCGPTPISGRAATLLWSGRVLLTGGSLWTGTFFCGWAADTELYDPLAEMFQAAGQMSRPRYNHSTTLLPDGTVFIAGGEPAECSFRGPFSICAGGTTASVESYDPVTGRSTFLGNMIARRSGQTATLLMNGTVLLAGGNTGDRGSVLSASQTAEIYTPPVPVPMPVVTDLRFDSKVVPPGASFSANIYGSGLTGDTFFDVRFTSPGSSLSAVALNWQKGIVESHDVPAGLGVGTWTINSVRAHAIETDHTGIFFPAPATITVAPVTAQVVTGLQFDRPSVVAGGSYSVNLSGSNLTPQTFFDVLFTAPGSATSSVALNWQTGLAASHAVPLSTVTGNWTINGVRAHQEEADHTGDFNPVSATITVQLPPALPGEGTCPPPTTEAGPWISCWFRPLPGGRPGLHSASG
jgi:hypothetical protein